MIVTLILRRKKMITEMSITQFTGRLTKDPELRQIAKGSPLLTFAIAYNTRRSTDASGSHSNFLDVEVWEKQAVEMSSLLAKGMQVTINGEMVQKRWKNTRGESRSKMSLVADEIIICDLKRRPAKAPDAVLAASQD